MKKSAQDDPQLEDLSLSELTEELRFITGMPGNKRQNKAATIEAIRKIRKENKNG